MEVHDKAFYNAKKWHLNNMRTFLTRTKALYIVNKHPCCIFVMEYNTQGNFGKYYDPQCFLCIITFSSTFYIFDFYQCLRQHILQINEIWSSISSFQTFQCNWPISKQKSLFDNLQILLIFSYFLGEYKFL